jgi:hypothetical protein
LDVVKHAVKTIVSNLTEKDNLSLVRYDDNAQVILELTKMDEAGRKKAVASVDNL